MIILTDGAYPLYYSNPTYSVEEHSRLVLASGTIGRATLTIGYYNDFNEFVPYPERSFLLNKRMRIEHGIGNTPILMVKGATIATKIAIQVHGLEQGESAGSGGGGGGSGIDDKTFIYNGTPLPSNTWTVTHNLGKFPCVVVTDANGVIVEAEAIYIDNNTVTINFNQAHTGKAYFN